MEMIVQLVVLGTLVESLTEVLKLLFVDGKLNKSQLVSIVVGLVLAFTINLDLFIAIGLSPVIPYVGIVAAGILISRGGNYVHDFISRINK